MTSAHRSRGSRGSGASPATTMMFRHAGRPEARPGGRPRSERPSDTCGRTLGRAQPPSTADHVRDHDPLRASRRAELEELLRRQEGQRRVVRVEHDHVPAWLVPLEVAAPVLDPTASRGSGARPLPRDVDHLGRIDRLQLQVGSATRARLEPRRARRSASRPPGGTRRREVGHVVERRHERVVEGHRAWNELSKRRRRSRSSSTTAIEWYALLRSAPESLRPRSPCCRTLPS